MSPTLHPFPPPQLFYHTLELSKGVVTRFELVTFLPDNIKSQYFFLSRILEQLPHLTHLVITKVTQAMCQSKGIQVCSSFLISIFTFIFTFYLLPNFYFYILITIHFHFQHFTAHHYIYCPLYHSMYCPLLFQFFN